MPNSQVGLYPFFSEILLDTEPLLPPVLSPSWLRGYAGLTYLLSHPHNMHSDLPKAQSCHIHALLAEDLASEDTSQSLRSVLSVILALTPHTSSV